VPRATPSDGGGGSQEQDILQVPVTFDLCDGAVRVYVCVCGVAAKEKLAFSEACK